MPHTRVVHCKKDKYDVYVGRPSKWGNPFIIGRDGDRAAVVQRYEAYILNNQELYDSISDLKGKVLACWCAPEACHADVLARMADWREEEEKYDGETDQTAQNTERSSEAKN